MVPAGLAGVENDGGISLCPVRFPLLRAAAPDGLVPSPAAFSYMLYCCDRLAGQVRKLPVEGGKNNKMNSSKSNILRRLVRNKGGFFGLIIIGAAIFVACTAYLIAPDPSPDANRMIVEIGGRQPGFTQQFLL